MLANSEAIQQFKQRRHDSLISSIARIELILDFTKMYKLNNDSDKVVKILTNLKYNIKKDSNELKYLNIDSKKDYNKISENIYNSIFNIYENIIQKEVYNFQKEIMLLLNFAENNQLARCTKSIDDVVALFESSKYIEMKDNLFKIKQDILSSLNYNDKIEKEESIVK